MDSLWQTLYPYGYLAIATIEIIILLFAYPFFRLSQNQAMIVLPIVLVSTIYDNIILWSGRWIGKGEQPIANVNWRFEWLWLYGFVHPQSGETYWYILPYVNTEIFNQV